MFFFLSGFSFTDTDNSQDSRGKEGTIFYSNLQLPPAPEHWNIYLQFYTWDDYHVFLITTLVAIKNQQFQDVTTQISGFSLIWITKLFSHVLKILNYDGLWENEKLSDENQRFYWIKSIHWHRLVNIDSLADIDLSGSMIWLA